MLAYSNFEGVIGLFGNEFNQANVTGTKLPEDIKEFRALDTVEESSKNARKIFFAMLLGCVYSWLTIATTTDVLLLTNSEASPLPIIGTEMPIAYFYWAAPFVLMCIYVYFHFYLHKLWVNLASLPAIFPDGKRLEERAYPWLLNDLVCRHFELLKQRPFPARSKEWITIFLAWWAVPITLIGFWLRYLPRHEWLITCLHIGLFTTSVAFANIFYSLCRVILRGKCKNTILLRKLWQERMIYYSLSPLLSALVLLLVSYGAIKGINPTLLEKNVQINFLKITELVPWAFQNFCSPHANFREKDVSIRPADYHRVVLPEMRIDCIKGAKLKDRNIEYADMYMAFLVKADFRNANLKKACLMHASLQKANFQNANLLEANLRGSKLTKSRLREANLNKANLKDADLQEADLLIADLQKANLDTANLKKAVLRAANLQEANLANADLQKADLWNASLRKANLWQTNLSEVDLSYADLTDCILLTQEQLEVACGDENTKLPPGLKIKNCPRN
jgi:uncharacterized protein YjbI with pentapeptide repeats